MLTSFPFLFVEQICIVKKCEDFGVPGAQEDVDNVHKVLVGSGLLFSFCLVVLYNNMQINCLCWLCITGKWPHKQFNNADILRLKLACDVLEVDVAQSMYNVAVNTMGDTQLSHK